MSFTSQQIELRESDPIKIVRTWASSPFVYGADSKQRVPNPDAHPLICQREDGTYCDVEGRPLAASQVPEYIRDEGRPPKETIVEGQTISLKDAMLASTTIPTPTPKTPAKRGRK